MGKRESPRLASPALKLIGVVLIATLATSGVAWALLDDNGAKTIFASFLFQDGSKVWEPIDIDKSIETIEAFQEMENAGLQNMILEVDRDPNASATDEELEDLWQLYRDSFESAKQNGWFEYQNAIRDGFYDDVTDPNHYPHVTYLTDGRDLDPARPEFLMYYQNPEKQDEMILAGFMYQQSAFDAHGEQIAGGLSRWHKHIYGAPVCFDHNLVPHGMHVQGACNGVSSSQSPEMMHVWFIQHPESQFASAMTIPSDVIKSPAMLTKDEFMRKHRALAEFQRK